MLAFSELKNQLTKNEIKLIVEARKIDYGEVTAVIRNGEITLIKGTRTITTDKAKK